MYGRSKRRTLVAHEDYSQLSRKRPPLVHEKVVTYERWSRTGKINEISPKLYRSTNNYYIMFPY